MDCNIITPKRLKTIAIAIINDTQPALMEEQSIEEPQSRSAKKKKLKQKQRKSIEKPASSSVLEYPDNNLLKRKIHISCDPLDDICKFVLSSYFQTATIKLFGIRDDSYAIGRKPLLFFCPSTSSCFFSQVINIFVPFLTVSLSNLS